MSKLTDINEFHSAYLVNLETATSQVEAYEKTEEQHIAEHGVRRFGHFNSFSSSRVQNNLTAGKVGGKMTPLEFAKCYVEQLPLHDTRTAAYLAVEKTHVERFGDRRYRAFSGFNASYLSVLRSGKLIVN